MKKGIPFLLMLVIDLACSAQNLVVNPGFEMWSKINKPTGWTTAQLCQKDSVNFWERSNACLQTAAASSTKAVGQKIAITPGKPYRLSFYYRTLVTGTEHGCRIWCHWEDEDNNPIVDIASAPILQPTLYMKSETWQEFSTEVTSPAGAYAFILEIRTYQNSNSWLDNVVFEETFATGFKEEHESLTEIYPNPASDYLTIRSIPEIQHIEVLNIAGVTKWSAVIQGEKSVTIPVSELTEGIYVLRILTSRNTILKKFIKKR